MWRFLWHMRIESIYCFLRLFVSHVSKDISLKFLKSFLIFFEFFFFWIFSLFIFLVMRTEHLVVRLSIPWYFCASLLMDVFILSNFVLLFIYYLWTDFLIFPFISWDTRDGWSGSLFCSGDRYIITWILHQIFKYSE